MLQVSVAVIAGTLLVGTVALLTVLSQLKRTLVAAEELSVAVRRELEPVLRSLRITLDKVSALADEAHSRAHETQQVLSHLRRLVEAARVTMTLVEKSITPALLGASGVAAGFGKAFRLLARMRRSRGGGT